MRSCHGRRTILEAETFRVIAGEGHRAPRVRSVHSGRVTTRIVPIAVGDLAFLRLLSHLSRHGWRSYRVVVDVVWVRSCSRGPSTKFDPADEEDDELDKVDNEENEEEDDEDTDDYGEDGSDRNSIDIER